jgi:hypothetical protein
VLVDGELVATQVVSAVPTVDGVQALSLTSSASSLTVPGAATHALLTVSPHATNGLRFREDGTNPTATNGLWVGPGGAVELTNLANVRLIGSDGTTGVSTSAYVSYRHYT